MARTWNFGQLHRLGNRDLEPRARLVFVPGLFPLRPRFHGYDGLLNCLEQSLAGEYPAREVLPFDYRATYWSPADLDVLAEQLVQQIDEIAGPPGDLRLFLAAHSFGGLILRRALILGADRPWFARLAPVLLLASTSRGLLPATRLQRALIWAGRGAGEWNFLDRVGLDHFRVGRLALAGLKPSRWLDALAVDWRALLRGAPALRVCQLLAEHDRIVDSCDDDDLLTLANFHQRVIAGAGHRFFMLKPIWFQQAEPEVLAVLQEVKFALQQVWSGPPGDR
jgi:alpha-beta hydrolase superfamily lysophospholipase